ncbi:MAG: ATP synthase F0 subunit B [Alphaproteobacteria bacterium]|nr:ATP synthase F0 subunit B [Alphaproteobacteria bacterium]
MLELLQHDANIWMVFSFVLLVFLLWKYGRGVFLAMIDARIDQIRREIENAENLRIEAQELLAQYQRKQRDAEKEAARIIETAKKNAEQIKVKAEADLEEAMARREKQLAQRIQRMEQDAKQEISDYAARLALKAAQEIIEKKLEGASAYDALVENSIASVGKQGKLLN